MKNLSPRILSCLMLSVQRVECELVNKLRGAFVYSDITKETCGLLIPKKNWDTSLRHCHISVCCLKLE